MKGQWFIVSAVLISGSLLTISLIFQSHFEISRSFYKNDYVKNYFENVEEFSKFSDYCYYCENVFELPEYDAVSKGFYFCEYNGEFVVSSGNEIFWSDGVPSTTCCNKNIIGDDVCP